VQARVQALCLEGVYLYLFVFFISRSIVSPHEKHVELQFWTSPCLSTSLHPVLLNTDLFDLWQVRPRSIIMLIHMYTTMNPLSLEFLLDRDSGKEVYLRSSRCGEACCRFVYITIVLIKY
jgi:hypothetical protein